MATKGVAGQFANQAMVLMKAMTKAGEYQVGGE
jgi:hypothetical protein